MERIIHVVKCSYFCDPILRQKIIELFKSWTFLVLK